MSEAYCVREVTTDAERQELFRLRYEVFVLEQHKYKESADHQQRVLIDSLDPVAQHLSLMKGPRMVGSLRQVRGLRHATPAMIEQFGLDDFREIPEEAFGFSGRLMLPKSERGGRGLLMLLHENYQRGRAAGAMLDFIICNPHLVKFYEQLGYRRYKRHFFDPDHGYNIPMVFVADDIEYLERIRSPFLPAARKWPGSNLYGPTFSNRFSIYRSIISPVVSPEKVSERITRKIDGLEMPIFAELDEVERISLLAESTHIHVEAGSKIVRRGDMGEELYIVIDGLAEASLFDGDGSQRVVSTIGRGDFFGELSVLTGLPRSLDITAVSDLELLFIDRLTLRKLIKVKPAIAAKLLFGISASIAERMDSINRHLLDSPNVDSEFGSSGGGRRHCE